MDHEKKNLDINNVVVPVQNRVLGVQLVRRVSRRVRPARPTVRHVPPGHARRARPPARRRRLDLRALGAAAFGRGEEDGRRVGRRAGRHRVRAAVRVAQEDRPRPAHGRLLQRIGGRLAGGHGGARTVRGRALRQRRDDAARVRRRQRLQVGIVKI